MTILHSLYRCVYRIAPRVADCIRRLYKNERPVWKLTQEEVVKASYFSDCQQKQLEEIHKELKYLCSDDNGSWTNQDTIEHYFRMGIDRVGSKISDFVFQVRFDKMRDKKQPLFANMLKHKYYTAVYLNAQGINISLPLGEINDKGEIYNGGLWRPLKQVLKEDNRMHYFCKMKDGNQGRGHVVIDYINDAFYRNGKIWDDAEVYKELANLTIEPYIIQHEGLNRIYANAVSSIRIVTVIHQNKIIPFAQCILIGAGGSDVSNLRYGGICVGMDSEGVMKGRGLIFQPADKRGSYTHHPDSGVVFDGTPIPMWKECVDLAIKAHAALLDIHSIGWDIAITPEGPTIIEANDAWGTMVQHYGGHHFKNEIVKYFGEE